MLEASCDSSTHSSRTLVIIYPGLYINVGSLTYTNNLMIQAYPTHTWRSYWKNVAELKCIKRNSMLLSSRCKAMSEFTLTVFFPLSMRLLGLFQLNWCSSEPLQQVTGWLNSSEHNISSTLLWKKKKLWSSSHTSYPF